VTKDSRADPPQPNNPLHGLTLETVVTQLVDSYGFPYLAERIKINCFKSDPSIKSSLTFLRRTLWAREQVEKLYVAKFAKAPRKSGIAKSKPKSTPLKPPISQPKLTPEKPLNAPNLWASGAYKKS
jgi:uncharacterized protein (DUF2132 family)